MAFPPRLILAEQLGCRAGSNGFSNQTLSRGHA
jgi:hypothetical protein